jgi:membrane protease YdiL (CAAX protease family)
MAKTSYLWVLVPYLCVFFGMLMWRSAWGALIGFHVGLLPVLLPRWRGIYPKFLSPVSKKTLIFIAQTGILGGLGLWLLWPYTGISSGFPAQLAALGLSGWVWLPFIVYFTLVNPWLEEAYWRNALDSSSRYPAPVDFLFAGYHLIILCLFVNLAWMLFAFVVLVMAGWFWRQVSRYTGSLLPAVFSHMLADLSLLIVLRGFAV